MLKRIYINNFRCLVNFELNLESINLFLGANGSGKTTVFDVFIVQINPFVMESESRQEASLPSWDMSNYAAWYSYLSQESQGKILKLTLELQKIIPGFDSFQNPKSGDARILSASFTRPSKAAYRLLNL